jgi:hypothetical protein
MRKTLTFILYLFLLSPFFSIIYTVSLGLPKTFLHFNTFLVAILGSILVFARKSINIPSYLWFLLVYSLYRAAVQFIIETDVYWLTQIHDNFLVYYATFIIIAIVKNTNISGAFVKNSIKIIKITIITAVIVSVIQVFDYGFLNAAMYRDAGDAVWDTIYRTRRSAIFGFENQNSLGLSFMPLAATFIAYILIRKDKYYLIYLILIGIIAMLSNARYVMVSYVVILVMFLWTEKLNLVKLLRLGMLGIIVIFTIAYTLQSLGYDFQEWHQERLLAEGSLDETTRYKAIYTFALFFPQNWLFGTGHFLTEEIAEASRFIASSSRIHVGYLSHLVSYGVVGSFLLWSFWFFLAKDLYRNAKKTHYWGAFFAFLIFFWAHATLVQFSMFFPGLIIALVYDKYHADKLQYSNQNIISTNQTNKHL